MLTLGATTLKFNLNKIITEHVDIYKATAYRTVCPFTYF